MARASEDPPSPVDAYAAAPAAVVAGSTPPPPSGYSQQRYATPTYAPVAQKTNVLAIVALVASGAGLIIPGVVIGGIVMGHIALSQIKRTGEGGHGFALAAVIVGYALFALEFLVVVAYIVFFVFIIGTAASSFSSFNPSDFG